VSAGRPARALLLALVVGLSLLGCGKKGPPVAPERRLPAAATGLQAVIDGPVTVVSWTNPRQRLDGTPLRDLTTVTLHRREETEPGEPKSAMLSSGRVVGYEPIATLRVDAPTAAADAGPARWTDRREPRPGRRYVYVVTAVDSQGRSSAPSERLVVDFVAAPGPPRDLAATPGDGRVALRWEPPAGLIDGTPLAGEIRYLVMRGPETGDPATPVTPEPVAGTDVTDTGLDNETAYRYAVRAVRLTATGLRALGAASPPATATPVDTTPPLPPSELLAIPGPAAVRLAWSPSPDPDVALYAIYRAGDGGDFLRIGSAPGGTTVFVDRDVTAGALYRYVVTALDRARRANESARSNEVRVRAE